METPYAAVLMWFRRDLRVADNAALFHALKAGRQVHCAFVFDTAILDGLPRQDRRLEFIRESAAELDEALRHAGGPAAGLIALHGGDEAARNAAQLLICNNVSGVDQEGSTP